MSPRSRGRPAASEPSALPTEVLLAAALEAFADRGYDGMSVRELARDLGVSHNLIPQRIGSKEDLWRAAVDHGFGHLMVAMTTTFADEVPEGDLGRLRALVTRFVEANAARPALLRIISWEAISPGPRFDYLFEHYIDPVRIVGAELMARLRATGEVRTESVALMYFFMTHGAGGPLALPALAGRFGEVVDPADPEAVHRHAAEAVAILFDGIVAHAPSIIN